MCMEFGIVNFIKFPGTESNEICIFDGKKHNIPLDTVSFIEKHKCWCLNFIHCKIVIFYITSCLLRTPLL